MPFGLTNAPSTFQSAMNDLLRPFLRRFVLVFFDNILIYSSNLSDHLLHLQLVLELLASNFFVAKLSKCVFAVDTVNYLGHVISIGGVAPDPEKVKAMLDWPEPRSLSTLQGFLGLTGFYRRFVRQYATLAAPLTDLLRSTKFHWSTEASLAFTALKEKMTTMPVLALPDFSKVFAVETDASAVAIGAVLSQDGHPLAYFSKKLCPRLQAASVYVREMCAGKTNQVADALSRKFADGEILLLTISSLVPSLINQLKAYYLSDMQGKQLVTKCQLDQETRSSYSYTNGLLYYQDKLFVPDYQDLRRSLIYEFHSTPTAGHSGVKPTVARLAASFSWPGHGFYNTSSKLLWSHSHLGSL